MIENTRIPASWRLEDTARPWTTNAERRWHYYTRAQRVKETRETFGWLAREQRVPKMEAVRIAVVPLAVNRRGIQDVAACYPAVKAAIDGLVDAGVVADDDPEHVKAICFYPTRVIGRDGLRVVITEATASD